MAPEPNLSEISRTIYLDLCKKLGVPIARTFYRTMAVDRSHWNPNLVDELWRDEDEHTRLAYVKAATRAIYLIATELYGPIAAGEELPDGA